MALVKGALAKQIEAFIKTQASKTQEDSDAAIKQFAENLEEQVYGSIKSVTITIPTGLINVTGANGGGPVVCTNAAPIVLDLAIK